MLKSHSVPAFIPNTASPLMTYQSKMILQTALSTSSFQTFQLDMVSNVVEEEKMVDIEDVLTKDNNNSSSNKDLHLITKQPPPLLLKSLASTLEVDNQVIYNSDQIKQRTKPIVCGHRGAIYQSLENTRHSIKKAYELGCQEVEIDVFLLKCGTLCVFHGSGDDSNPGLFQDYSSNMKGSILQYTYEEIRREFKFNPHHEEFACGSDLIHSLEQENECYIPTLEEMLLEAKKYGITVKIELKGPNTADSTLELVESLDMVDKVHFSSFELSRIQRIRELRPQRCPITGQHIYKTGALFDEVPHNFIQMALDVDASEVHLKYSLCTKSRVDDIHAAGMDSMCWMRGPIGMKIDITSTFYDVGNEDEVLFRVVMATGVKKMCVNKPDVLVQMLNQ